MQCIHHQVDDQVDTVDVLTLNEDEPMSQAIIDFLSSNKFSGILRDAIVAATAPLQNTIEKLKQELSDLKSTNIDMIRLFNNWPEKNLIKSSDKEVGALSDFFLDGDSKTFRNGGHRTQPIKTQKTTTERTINTNLISDVPSNSNSIQFKTNSSYLQVPKIISNDDGSPNFNLEPIMPTTKTQSQGSIYNKNTTSYNNSVLVDADGFQTKMSRRNKRKIVRGNATLQNMSLKAAKRLSTVYVGNLQPNTVENDVNEFLRSKFPNFEFIVDKLPRRINAKSVSFKVTVDPTIYNDFFKEELWPEGVIIKKFYFLKKKEGEASQNVRKPSEAHN